MYARPRTVEEAVAALAAPRALILCGGTDVFPAHVERPLDRPIVDISGIPALRGIASEGNFIRIGAAASWTDIVAAPLPLAFAALKEAAREVGSVQIQNRGTIGGNLCNASPAADGVPPLLALDAEVEIHGPAGRRHLPLSSFITGYRRTALAPGEMLVAVRVPQPAPEAKSAFVKLGARRYLVISIVMVAALIARDGAGRISRARIAVGAASEVARRLTGLEDDLLGLAASARPSSVVAGRHLASLSPIDDVRATARYRSDAAFALIREALDRAEEAGHDG